MRSLASDLKRHYQRLAVAFLAAWLAAPVFAAEPPPLQVKLESGEIFRSRSVAMGDARGAYVFSMHIIEDITEQRRAASERKQAGEENIRQLDELRRWQVLMLARADHYMEIKREVNELLRRLREQIRYPNQEGEGEP